MFFADVGSALSSLCVDDPESVGTDDCNSSVAFSEVCGSIPSFQSYVGNIPHTVHILA